MSDEKKDKVLSGYKKVGKKFIPPFTHTLGPMREASYVKQMLPQLIWWDVLSERLSLQTTIHIAESLAEYFKTLTHHKSWWSFATEYIVLTDHEISDLKKHLEKSNYLRPVEDALSAFLVLYPSCPLSRVFGTSQKTFIDQSYLSSFKVRLEELLDKRSTVSIHMQSQAIYMGFMLDRLKVAPGLALADFSEIGSYPRTERSRQVGASICSTLNGLIGQLLSPYESDAWATSFWQRGLEIEPINLEHLDIKWG